MSDVCPMFVPLTMILSTVKLVSVPNDVMFPCAAVDNVPERLVALKAPTLADPLTSNLKGVREPSMSPLPSPIITLPPSPPPAVVSY